MANVPNQILAEGCEILEPILSQYGFSFEKGSAGPSSGGPYASGRYVNGDRSIEIHFRFSLGLVTYHFGPISLMHNEYMKAALGHDGGNKYPGFSDDPLDGFRGLAFDLAHFGKAFLEGDAQEFKRCHTAAQLAESLKGSASLL